VADLVLSIRLTADGKGLVGEVRGSADEIKKLGQTAREANDQGRGAAEQFTGSLKRQADTLGMTRSQTLAYEAAQHNLTDAQRLGVAESVRAIDAYDRKQAMLGRVKMAAAAAAVVIATVLVGALKSSVAEAAAAEQAHYKLEAVLRATGYSAGLSKSQLDAMAESMKRKTGIDDDAIRSSMAVMLTFKQVQGDTFGAAMTMAADLTKLLGQDLQSSVLMLGKALEDPESGLLALRRAGVSFNDQQKDSIKTMVEFGDQSRALTVILQIMREQGIQGIAEAMHTGLTGATNNASLAWTDLMKAIGQTSVVKGQVEDSLSTWTQGLTDMKNVIESGDWLDRLTFFGAGIVTPDLKAMRDVRQYTGGREGVLAREGQQAQAAEGAFSAQEAARELAIAQASGLESLSGEGWQKLLENRQKQELAAFQQEEELLKKGAAGWVAYADAVFAESERELLALASIADAQNKAAEAVEQKVAVEAKAAEKKLAQQVSSIQIENMTELELLNMHLEQKAEILNAWAGEDLQRQQIAKQQIELVELQHQAKLGNTHAQGVLARRNFEQMNTRQQTQFVLGELASLTAGVAQHNRFLFNVNKAAGIGTALMNAYIGISKTLAEYPFPWNIAMAALHGVVAFAQVEAIRSAEFGGGTSAPSIGGGTAIPVTPAPDFAAFETTPAETTAAAAAPPPTQIYVTLQGALQSSETIRELIEMINKEAPYGAEVILTS